MDKKNLRTIQQFSPKGFVRQRVWQSDQLHCNIYCFEPGQQNSLHRHPVADEVVFCWEGGGIIVVGNNHSPFRAGDTVLVPKNTPSRLPQHQSEPADDDHGRAVSSPS